MSLPAVTWVIYDAETDIGEKLEGSELRLLLVMADIAHKDGTHIWQSIKRYAQDMKCAPRTVSYAIDGLLAKGFIRKGDQSIVAHLPANRRPIVYELCMNARDIDDDDDQDEQTDMQNLHTRESRGANRGANRGAIRSANRGASCLHINRNTKEEPIEPIEPVRPDPTNNDHEWTPSQEAISYAKRMGADPQIQAARFREVLAKKHTSNPPSDASFMRFIDSGVRQGFIKRPVASTPRVQPKNHRHTMSCKHVTQLMKPYETHYSHERDGKYGPSPWMRVCQDCADQLNQGKTSQQALANIGITTEVPA